MVENLKKVVKEFRKENKDISVLAIFKMDEITDGWSVIFSSNSYNQSDEKSSSKEYSFLIDQLNKNLTQEEKEEISRVAILPSENHLVKAVLKSYKSGAIIERNTNINGNLIHEGVIIESTQSK